ncbi:MAG: nitrate reductase molybdenum cofactor assembly chaperone [Porticoccaceae bacterium]|nr:MAG: nitrate reductase molybdenum cofactor assembly chaperone [Porticoccaceae bacterium]
MDILKVISRLMGYPRAELQAQVSGIESVINEAREISPDMRQQLIHLLHEIYDGDLLDAQEAYTGLFDRGRSLSLLLFEHVHGESRDRGQAMVNLLAIYEEHGFSINARELPDHIPLHLEFLAHRPDLEVREGLSDVSHILGVLSARLQERESSYAALFDALLMISGVNVDISELREKVAGEKRDDTPEELDKIWEEEAITFGAGDALGSSCPSSTPVPPKKSANDAVAVRWAN